MKNKNINLKIALAYISIFLLIFLIALPPVLRFFIKSDNIMSTNNSNIPTTLARTVLHCTRIETVQSANYNIQIFNTYNKSNLEKVIIRYTRTGTLDNQNNEFETEMNNLRNNSNVSETIFSTGSKFEISKEGIEKAKTDSTISSYFKSITEEEDLLVNNNYTCQTNKF